jgi:hypothetical protein
VNFKDYFLNTNTLGQKINTNTGNQHHQTTGRITKMGQRNSLNLVAKSQSQPKKSLHPKIDLCIKLKKDIPLVGNEPFDIMKKYKECPTPEEPIKAIKKYPVSLQMIKPNVYILSYKGE